MEWSWLGDEEEKPEDTPGLMKTRETSWWNMRLWRSASHAHPRKKCAVVSKNRCRPGRTSEAAGDDLLLSPPTNLRCTLVESTAVERLDGIGMANERPRSGRRWCASVGFRRTSSVRAASMEAAASFTSPRPPDGKILLVC